MKEIKEKQKRPLLFKIAYFYHAEIMFVSAVYVLYEVVKVLKLLHGGSENRAFGYAHLNKSGREEESKVDYAALHRQKFTC